MSESVEERIYIVPLSRARLVPRYKRAAKAVSLLRKFVQRHMKPEEILVDPSVNEAIWENGMANPPRKIRVRLSKDNDGIVTINLAEVEE
jgi:large subunit ribosomal protein L31e